MPNLNLFSKYQKELINFSGPFSAIFLNLFFTPFLLSQFGILKWSLFLLIGTLQPLSFFFSMGIPQLLFEKFPNIINRHNQNKKYFNEFLKLEIIYFIGSLIFFLVVFYILKFNLNIDSVHDLNIHILLILISLILLFRMLEFFYITILNSVQKFYTSNISQVISSSIKWIFGYLGVIYLEWSLIQFILFNLIISIIFTIFLFIVIRIKIKLSIKNLNLKKDNLYQKTKLQISFFAISFFICLTQFDKFIVLIWQNDLTFFAKYSLVLTISSCIPMITQPLVTLYTSTINNDINRELKGQILDSLNNLFIFIAPISIFLFFNLEIILNIWLKNIFFSNEIIFTGKIFIIGFTFVSILSIFLNYFITIKKQFFFTTVGGVLFCTFVFFSYFVLKQQEIVIFSIIWVIIIFIFTLILFYSIYKNFNKKIKINFIKNISNSILKILVLISLFYFLNVMNLSFQFNYILILAFNFCLFLSAFFILIKYNYEKI